MSVFLQCPLKFKLSYIDHVDREPQGAFLFGRAVHSSIEESEKHEWWRDENNAHVDGPLWEFFDNDFVRQVDEAGGDTVIRWGGKKLRDTGRGGEDLEWCRMMGPRMLRAYCGLRQVDDAEGFELRPDAVEARYQVGLPSGSFLVVVLDAFLFANFDTGHRRIRDYKTGQVGRSDPLQLAIYAWVAREIFGEEYLTELVYLRSKNIDTLVKVVDVRPMLDEVPDNFAFLEAMSGLELYPAWPNNFCGSCSVRHSCPAWGAFGGEESNGEDPAVSA